MKEITRKFSKILQQRLYEDLNFIQIVLGPRQVGKTTGLQQIISRWQGQSLMVSADEVITPTRDWLNLQWEKARNLAKGSLFVIDEVQKIPHWSETVKYLYDRDRTKRHCKIVLLGSASLTLIKGLAESLVGRYEIIPATHWDLQECYEAFGWELIDFLKYGGYPAAAKLVSDFTRWRDFIRNSIIEPVLIKDILGLSSVHKPALFRQTFELAMAYPAQEISLQKLLGQLQESGNVTTIKHYLELFDAAFLVKTLQKFTGSEIKKRGSSPKIIPLNNALIHAFHSPDDVDSNAEWFGRVFEAAIGAALSKSRGNLYYWREGKFEVDFILQSAGKIYAIEVKSGRKRSTRGLEKFIQQYPDSIPFLIDQKLGCQLLGCQDVDFFINNH
ncbi:ATP-binding protein [bacterium]|nr:ATP-binding protein [bacterium]